MALSGLKWPKCLEMAENALKWLIFFNGLKFSTIFLHDFFLNFCRNFASLSSMNHTRNLSSNSSNYSVLGSLEMPKRFLEIFIRISLQMHSETTPKIEPKYNLFIIFIIETLSSSLVRFHPKYNLRSVPPVISSIYKD